MGRPASHAPSRGRPPSTNARAIEEVALALFARDGFEVTTVEGIAAAAGVSRRTFFRYFDSKVAVLWHDFDHEVAALRACLDGSSPALGVMDAVREAVVAVNRYSAEDVPELRTRMQLIGAVPALQSSAAVHYDAWERTVSDFVARRTGERADALVPLATGRATLAACRAAFDVWVRQDALDLTVYLDAALRALSAGFSPEP